MNKLKKTLALLLSLVMILSLLPAAAFADDGEVQPAQLPEEEMEVSEIVEEEAAGDTANNCLVYEKNAEVPSEIVSNLNGNGFTSTSQDKMWDSLEKGARPCYTYYDDNGQFTACSSPCLGTVSFDTIYAFPSAAIDDSYYDIAIGFSQPVKQGSVALLFPSHIDYGFGKTPEVAIITTPKDFAGTEGATTALVCDNMLLLHSKLSEIEAHGLSLNHFYTNGYLFPFSFVNLSEENEGTDIIVSLVKSSDDNFDSPDVVSTFTYELGAAKGLLNPSKPANEDPSVIIENTPYYYYSTGLDTNGLTISIPSGWTEIQTVAGPHYAPKPAAVAQIGSTKYTTLAEAIADVQDGETITLLADVPNAVGLSVPEGKNFTVDFNGHTYTVDNPGAGSAGTETSAFQLLKNSTIVFKNGTINVAESNLTAAVAPAKNIMRVIQNYANLTLDNMTIDAQNQYGSYQGGKYGLSFNNGTSVIKDTKIITSSNDVVAFDVYLNDYYTATSVTVQGNSEITGSIEVAATSADNGKDLALNLNGGSLSGAIKMGNHAGEADITKADGFTKDAPAGYKWDDNGKLVEATYVARIGDTQYETLSAAIADVPTTGAETTITMIGDETINVATGALTIAAGKNVVIDLNGNTVTGYCESGKASALITNNGTLKLKDSTDTHKDGTGSGKMYAGANPAWIYEGGDDYSGSYASNMITNRGNLTIESGYYESTTSGSAAYVIDNYTNGIVVINGGHLYNYHTSAIRLFCNSATAENSVTVNGGIIEGYCAIWVQGVNQSTKGSLTINDGTFKTTEKAVVNGEKEIYEGSSVMYMSSSNPNMSMTIKGGTFETNVGAWGNGKVTITDGGFKGYVYSATQTGFITGGIYADVPTAAYIANGYVAVANTDEATKEQYPYKVQLKAFEVDKDNSFNTKTDVNDLVDVADVVAVVTGNISEATDITISVAVDDTVTEAPAAVTNAAETAGITAEKIFEVHPVVTFTKTVNNEVVDVVAKVENASDYVKEGASFTFTVTGLKSNHRYTIYHYDASGNLEDTFNNVLTDADGNATVTLSSFSYLLAEDAGEITCAGYLQTANADILSSLMWNLYFHIDNYDSLNNPRILVTSEYDSEIDGKTYPLTFDSKRSAYMITVPIRPRLIDQEVGFTLVDDNGTYSLRFGSASGTEYVTIPFSFNQYLNTVTTTSNGELKIIPGLRVWRDVLLSVWPAAKYR